MKYINAMDIFPQHLLEEIQKYIGITGEKIVYFPSNSEKKQWGSVSGKRKEIENRNSSIRCDYAKGLRLIELENKYFLSQDTLRKIIYCKNK